MSYTTKLGVLPVLELISTILKFGIFLPVASASMGVLSLISSPLLMNLPASLTKAALAFFCRRYVD